MKFGSLFSGIGGFDLALERAGFDCAWQCEIDKACQSILSRHFNARIYNDVRSINRSNAEPVDVICGGFPCQDLSVAGKRAGLAGERSGLWFEFARIIAWFTPQWVLIENVPGLLSSNGGKDFKVIIDKLVELGYGVVWRVLDAQYFGVAQRRRRVFIVGSLGTGRAAEVLFERESSPWDTAPSREKGQGFAAIAGTLFANAGGLERPAGNANELDFCIPVGYSETGQGYWMPGISALRSQGERPSYPTRLAFGGGNTSGDIDVATSCNVKGGSRLDFDTETFITFSADRDGINTLDNLSPTLMHKGDSPEAHKAYQKIAIANKNIGVRRLMPVECERLQGFPDGWTEGQSDSARYRQLGNAVAVPVVEWIARRIS